VHFIASATIVRAYLPYLSFSVTGKICELMFLMAAYFSNLWESRTCSSAEFWVWACGSHLHVLWGSKLSQRSIWD